LAFEEIHSIPSLRKMADEGETVAVAPVLADPQKVRAIKIKTGVAKRLAKEKLSYDQEVKEQLVKIEQFKAEGKDQYFMKQKVECLQESKQMIPDVQKRFEIAYEELKALMDAVPANDPMAKTEEFKAALTVMEDTKSQLVWT